MQPEKLIAVIEKMGTYSADCCSHRTAGMESEI